MSEATLVRLELAERLAPAWIDLPGVAAVVVSGSTARGLADDASDLELGVYWTSPPDDALRQRAVDRLGAVLLRRYSCDIERGWFGVDNVLVDGFPIDVAMNTVATIDAEIEAVENVDLLGMIAEVRAITGADIVAGWQARLGIDDALRRTLVTRELRPLPASAHRLDVARAHPIRALERQLQWATVGLRAAFPLDHRWFPGLKAAIVRVDDLPSSPTDSRARITRGLSGPTAEAGAVLLAWLDEVFDAAAAVDIDVESARQRLHSDGRPLAAPSEVRAVRRGQVA